MTHEETMLKIQSFGFGKIKSPNYKSNYRYALLCTIVQKLISSNNKKALSIWHQTTIEIIFLYNVSKIWDKYLVFLTERSSKVNCA